MKGVALCVALSMAVVSAPALRAQSTLHDVIGEDSLSATKVQLRGYAVAIEDSVASIQSLGPRLSRAQNTAMTAVIRSIGQQLGLMCGHGSRLATATADHVGYFVTNDDRANRMLASYRLSLGQLSDDLARCGHDDSVATASGTDPARLAVVIDSASTAITRYNGVRDALFRVFGMTMPAKGKMWDGH